MATIAETVEKRRRDWQRLEQLIEQLGSGKLRHTPGMQVAQLSELYRSVCADLAMSDQYRLSPETTDYLHGLVAKAHHTLYRSQRFRYRQWMDVLFYVAPRQIFSDRCVHLCAMLFFGLFCLSTYLAYHESAFPGFAERVLGEETIDSTEKMFSERDQRARGASENFFMVAFYIYNNTGIGLTCFALGPLIIPGLMATVYNAVVLGATFGYMARPEALGGDSFLNFVTAHGAFELTAIALAAAAGLRIGTGWMFTGGLSRSASLQLRAREAVPVMAASGVLFFLAALTEGLLSPTNVPYLFKASWLIFSSTLLMIYFVVLGYNAESKHAVG